MDTFFLRGFARTHAGVWHRFHELFVATGPESLPAYYAKASALARLVEYRGARAALARPPVASPTTG